MAEFEKKIAWRNIAAVIVIPIGGFIAALWTPLVFKTFVLALIFYVLGGIGITAGYHRLWSHRSYTASLPLRICLAACGCAAVQGSIREWTVDHRVHHKFTDSDKDPYSVTKGIFFAHIGWLFHETDRRNDSRIPTSDLDSDPVVRFQNKHYPPLMLFTAFGLPTLIAGLLWNDWKGGLVYAGIIRMFFLHQATFCVNSLAHILGEQKYDDDKSAKDSVITAVITFGEGYHNFHHAFPSDYRNAMHWYQWDPTAWTIWACEKIGLASDLKQFRKNEIEQNVLQQKMKALSNAAARLDWGTSLEALPTWTWDEFQEAFSKGRKLIVVAAIVHDVGSFVHEHPGGMSILQSHLGKDATGPFNGEVYKHSTAAHNVLARYRVAVIPSKPGHEVPDALNPKSVHQRMRKVVAPVTMLT